jgi:hypothetical protein
MLQLTGDGGPSNGEIFPLNTLVVTGGIQLRHHPTIEIKKIKLLYFEEEAI